MERNDRSFFPHRSRLLERQHPVTFIVVSMIIILAIALGTAGVVLVGMEGLGRGRAPRLADKMARAAQHLNGDGQPPKSLTRILH